MNESNPGAFGIPEYMPPTGGETFIENLPAPAVECATMNESNPGAFGIPDAACETFKVRKLLVKEE